METYQVLCVFGDFGKTHQWYVVNVKTKQVQSVWKSSEFMTARKTSEKLNQWEKQAVKKTGGVL